MFILKAPEPMVLVPGRAEAMPLFPAPGRGVTAGKVSPAPYTPPKAPTPPQPSQRWRVSFAAPEVDVPGRAAPMPMATPPPTPPPPPPLYATGFATSVALMPAGGTNVTSTPANLMIGPISYIQDFTINTLDAGTF